MKTSFLSSFGYSFSIIFLSDITDKSIFLIIFLSKKLPSLTLFLVSLSSVLLMNYLSILIGYYLPKLISLTYMKIIAFILFTTFGILSLIESQKKDEKINELMELTKKEFSDTENDYSLMVEDNEIETDVESNKELFPSILRTDTNVSELSHSSRTSEGSNYGTITAIFFALCLSDFGDKSQLAIVTMAALFNIYGILLGSTLALIGTVTLAVLFGNWISEKVSPKKLLLIGGLIFLTFGAETLYNLCSS
jgi:putative Ca2+/H+ antiporter (TMEM165/GDT1 family)